MGMRAKQSESTRVHTLLYFGPLDQNFQALLSKSGKDIDWSNATYIDGDRVRKADRANEKKVTGFHFRYMRASWRLEEDFVVGVDSIVLRAPVLLSHERHMDGKWFAANNRGYFEDDSAMRLLVDMITANPEYRDALGRLVRELGREKVR